jgi:hypothetical protein
MVAVVMLRRDPSIVVVMDVRVISSTMAMVDRAHDSRRKLLLSATAAKTRPFNSAAVA